MGREAEEIITENEIPRRLAKLEDALVALAKCQEDGDPRLVDLERAVARLLARRGPDVLDHVAPLLAIACLAGLEGIAIYRHEDGAMLLPVVAAIAALAGVKMGDIIRDILGTVKKGDH